jgi:molecular chaperone DnaK
MSRLTIDYGIDLGTTNSSIAVFDRTGPRIIRNNENEQFTPSAVWIEKNGALRVGRAAKERALSDPRNGAIEFKLMMGKAHTTTFQNQNRSFKPEELSAEVLKSLKEDVIRSNDGEVLESAVITVPAAFDLPETEATRRAANLAGISYCPLLQEPIAASLAYGFENRSDNAFWLVYDIGGGTFDAAVMHVHDGAIHVVNHGGDMNLGGKLIDWDVVEQVFVPALSSFRLSNFYRGTDKWRTAFGKLKLHAERAKIALTRDTTYEIAGEYICPDDSGEPVLLDIVITRSQLELLIEPHLVKTINICRNVLKEQKLGPADISKIVLVGGPTVTPLLRQILPDRKAGLGIPIDFSVDPLTVVAQGAALFAAGQRKPSSAAQPRTGEFTLSLEYKPIGSDTEPLVAGKIEGPGTTSFQGFVIRLLSPDAQPPWDSGRLPLSSTGTFIANLRAEREVQNTFQAELYDASGRKVLLQPSSFPYTVGLVISDPPLPYDIGIAMADDKVDVLFKKGTPLPAKASAFHRTALLLRKGDPKSHLRIPFIQGNEPEHAYLNRKIGELIIPAGSLKYDLPAGSEIEIRLSIDSSQHITGTVLVNLLDEEFTVSLDGLIKQPRPFEELKKEFEEQEKRLEQAREMPEALQGDIAADLDKITKENAIGEVSRLLAAGDKSEAVRCDEQLLAVKAVLQRIEDALEGPKLKAEAQQEIAWTEEILESASVQHQKAFALLRPEVEAAINGSSDVLRRKINDMCELRMRILGDNPDYWIGNRDYLLVRKGEMLDQTQATLWFQHADRAINSNNIDGLRTACRQLWALMPRAQQARGYGGGTVRARGPKG